MTKKLLKDTVTKHSIFIKEKAKMAGKSNGNTKTDNVLVMCPSTKELVAIPRGKGVGQKITNCPSCNGNHRIVAQEQNGAKVLALSFN